MSLADVIAAEVADVEQPDDDRLRESWRVVGYVKRSTQHFRARLVRTLPLIENEIGTDEQFGDVAASIAVMVRILDWTIRDLDRLRLPRELFEVVSVQRAVRVVSARGAPSSGA